MAETPKHVTDAMKVIDLAMAAAAAADSGNKEAAAELAFKSAMAWVALAAGKTHG